MGEFPWEEGASPECFILWNNRWFSARHKNTVYNDCLGISVVTVKNWNFKSTMQSKFWRLCKVKINLFWKQTYISLPYRFGG